MPAKQKDVQVRKNEQKGKESKKTPEPVSESVLLAQIELKQTHAITFRLFIVVLGAAGFMVAATPVAHELAGKTTLSMSRC